MPLMADHCVMTGSGATCSATGLTTNTMANVPRSIMWRSSCGRLRSETALSRVRSAQDARAELTG